MIGKIQIAPFKGDFIEYGVIETDVFSDINMGENTANFIKTTAGHYVEFAFADYLNGCRSDHYADANDIYDANHDGWEVKARDFRLHWGWNNARTKRKRNITTNIPFCSATDGQKKINLRGSTKVSSITGGPSWKGLEGVKQDHIDAVKEKFDRVSGIIVVDTQYLHTDGVCRYWKITSDQVLSLFEEGLWRGRRRLKEGKRTDEFITVSQDKRRKSVQTFISTMSFLFEEDFELENWLDVKLK